MSGGPDALGRAGSALRYWQTRQSALSHNLANTSTSGFKGEKLFARVLESAEGVERRLESVTDHSAGAISNTGRTFDLALEGDGFFVVDTPDGARLTRSGSFRREDGFLVDPDGNTVRGNGGPVAIPEGGVTISATGAVLVDDVEVDRLEIARPRRVEELRREDGARFDPGPEGIETLDPAAVSVRQGALEESNVNPVDAMVEMLEIQRRFASVERTIRVLDEVASTAATQLGRLK